MPQLIVADGSSLYFIDYQVRQVQRWPIGNSPLAVLLNPKRDNPPLRAGDAHHRSANHLGRGP